MNSEKDLYLDPARARVLAGDFGAAGAGVADVGRAAGVVEGLDSGLLSTDVLRSCLAAADLVIQAANVASTKLQDLGAGTLASVEAYERRDDQAAVQMTNQEGRL